MMEGEYLTGFLLHMMSSFPSNICWRDGPSPLYSLCQWFDHMHAGNISGFFMLFHCFPSPSLHQCYAALMAVTLQYFEKYEVSSFAFSRLLWLSIIPWSFPFEVLSSSRKFNFHVFVNVPVLLLLLISNFIPQWLEKVLSIIAVFLHIWRHVL